MPRSKTCRRIGPVMLTLEQRRNVREHIRRVYVRAGSLWKAGQVLGIGENTVADVMSGRGTPCLAAALRISKRLGITVEQLVNTAPSEPCAQEVA